jgi:hypothetical protein
VKSHEDPRADRAVSIGAGGMQTPKQIVSANKILVGKGQMMRPFMRYSQGWEEQ